MPRGPREADSHVAESKALPSALKCFSSSVICKFQACLIPKEKGCVGSSEAVLAGQLPDNPWLCLGVTLTRVELTHLRTRPKGAQSLSKAGTPSSGAPGNAGSGISLCPGPSPYPLALFSLGTRTTSNPLPGAFSLPEVLCFILGALLFLVLVILVTQLLRWTAERRDGLQGELGTRESVWKQEMEQM